MKVKRALKQPVSRAPNRELDPLQVNNRLYRQLSVLLTQLEEGDEDTVSMRERIMALATIARIQAVFVGLRKEHQDDGSAGSAVRKYASAFQAKNGIRGGETVPGPAEPDAADVEWLNAMDPTDDDPAAA